MSEKVTDERDPGGPPAPAAAGEPPDGVDRGDRVHEFRGDGLTVTWSRRRCTHVAACVFNLPRVFMPGQRPWVDVDQASADAIARTVARCPTGALHFARTDGGTSETVPAANTVRVSPSGPLYLHGDLEVFDESGARRLTDTRVALCRCGRSENRPFCDGAHETGFRDDGGIPAESPSPDVEVADTRLRVRPEREGPLRLEGRYSLASADRRNVLSCSGGALCRCGRSANKPFCDGSHRS